MHSSLFTCRAVELSDWVCNGRFGQSPETLRVPESLPETFLTYLHKVGAGLGKVGCSPGKALIGYRIACNIHWTLGL